MSLFGDEIADDDFDNGFDDLQPAFEPQSDGLQAPQKSDILIGHEKIENDMLSLWDSGRMPHALVFNGLKGIGKATFTYRLSRFILKESAQGGAGGLFGEESNPESLYIAPEHPVFNKIASGGHPDFLYVNRKTDEKTGKMKTIITRDDLRVIPKFFSQKSSDGGWRIVMVDDANMMSSDSQNVLLKILEEPPKNALLILVTHGAGGLLPTIRSRCRFVAFDPLSEDHITTLLNKSSGAPIMPSDKDLLIAMSEGSAGKAIELYEEGGIESATILLNALAQIDTMSEDQIDALSLSYGKSGDTKIIQNFTFILNWWFQTLIDIAVSGLKTRQIGGIDLVIPQGHDLKSLLQRHEDVENHIQSCINGNLDKRYMIYKTLRMIQA